MAYSIGAHLLRKIARHSEQSGDNQLTFQAQLFLTWVRANPRNATTFLISCTRRKLARSAPAGELYNSPLFKEAKRLAIRLGASFKILSAKHALVEPNTILAPYDLSLELLPPSERRNWAEKISAQLAHSLEVNSNIAILAGQLYTEDLSQRLSRQGRTIREPFRHLSAGQQLSFIKRCHRLLDREHAVTGFYSYFELLAERRGLTSLPNLLRQDIPQQGVYFFFDPREHTSFSNTLPRLVRVGTHAVSLGSKATLRNRLRTHFGTSEGLGNHRGSVFRLHVGEALINRWGLRTAFPNWAKGQSASRRIARTERDLENSVSNYIASLVVLFVEVADKSRKESLRSVLESNAIALFTEQMAILDPPGPTWLGLDSSQRTIRQSGLWNVRNVGDELDLKVIQKSRHLFETKLL